MYCMMATRVCTARQYHTLWSPPVATRSNHNMQGQQYVYCGDVTAGAEDFPIPAIIDDPHGLRASGLGAPPLFPTGFSYAASAAELPMTPAARRFLDHVYPPRDAVDLWAGCRRTKGACRRTSSPSVVHLSRFPI